MRLNSNFYVLYPLHYWYRLNTPTKGDVLGSDTSRIGFADMSNNLDFSETLLRWYIPGKCSDSLSKTHECQINAFVICISCTSRKMLNNKLMRCVNAHKKLSMYTRLSSCLVLVVAGFRICLFCYAYKDLVPLLGFTWHRIPYFYYLFIY